MYLFNVHLAHEKTVNKYVLVGLVTIEMASNLKTTGRIFLSFCLVSQMKTLKPNFGLFFV